VHNRQQRFGNTESEWPKAGSEPTDEHYGLHRLMAW